MASPKDVLKQIADNEVKFVDFRFTDTVGREHHVSVPTSAIDEDKLESGQAFDGSSIAGWKGIEASDMLLIPDLSTANMDPFREEPTLILSCDVVEPSDLKGYDRDPRSLAKRAEAYLKSSGLGDTAYFGPEPEFFVFDGVTWNTDMSGTFVKIKSEEASWSTGLDFEGGNTGHRPSVRAATSRAPVDSFQDMRSEMCLLMEQMGVPVEVHHHEVAGAGQLEIGTSSARWCSAPTGRRSPSTSFITWPTPTARPPPSCPSPSSATTVRACTCTSPSGRTARTCSRQRLRRPVGLRAVLHRRHHQARPRAERHHQPGHQLVQAPGSALRSPGQAGLLGPQPLGLDPHPLRRQPEGPPRRGALPGPLANPYLAFSALMMAGLDGVQNKIHPGDPADKNLYDLPPEEDAKIPTVCASLEEALEALDKDREFLTRGGVFSNDMLNAYIDLKMGDVNRLRMTTHPIEFDMYYSLGDAHPEAPSAFPQGAQRGPAKALRASPQHRWEAAPRASLSVAARSVCLHG